MDNETLVQQANQAWADIMAHLEKSLSAVSVDRWFRNLTPRSVEEGVLCVQVPDEFFKNWIEDHYLDILKSSLRESALPIHDIRLEISSRRSDRSAAPIAGPAFAAEASAAEPQPQPRKEAPLLSPKYTFKEFVVGPSNRFAHAASLAVADQPAKAYNPLFIYGPVGLGKTHLMQAIGHEVYSRNPGANILYITSEKFTNQLINAIQNQTTRKFRDKYRSVDILLIDDIHFIAGKEATQEEFFHTFNALYDSHKQIVVSSDRPPKDIVKMEERLVSRFEWGLVTDIQKPDFETRSAILRKKAERHSLPVPDSVTNFIAEVVLSNIRELEGSLMRVVAYAQLIGRSITVELAQEVLKNTVKESERRITIDTIQKKVCDFFSIKSSDMSAKKRSKNIVLPRQIAMFLSREMTDFSLPEIGGYFGGRDHSTVIHACEKIRLVIEKDGAMRDTVARIRQEIHN